MTLLDAQGQPLPASGALVDQILELVAYFDQNQEHWTKLETHFDEQLKIARGHAALLIAVSIGEQKFDMASPVGVALARLAADVVVKAMTLKAREEREEGKVIPMPKREEVPDGDNSAT
jgi:hypothetical protein